MRPPKNLSGLYLVLCVFCMFADGCGTEQNRPKTEAPIRIERLEPAFTLQGQPFNVQPNGDAAIAVVGASLPVGASVLWNGEALETGEGASQGWVGASVPNVLYRVPSRVPISIRAPDGRTSNVLTFTVYADTGPAPEALSLYPPETSVNTPFNVQPNGDSAISVTGKGFLPGAIIYAARKKLKTAFSSDTSVSAAIPKSVFGETGDVPIVVKNIDGKSSNALTFKVTSKR